MATLLLIYRANCTVSRYFTRSLSNQLRSRGIEVITRSTYFTPFFKKRTKGDIAIGIDLFRDNGYGRGLQLSKDCSNISRNFAYNLSNVLDTIIPRIPWRDFKFISRDSSYWRKFFYKVDARANCIFSLYTERNISEEHIFHVTLDDILTAYVDEIIRCIRSDFNEKNYQQRVEIAKKKRRTNVR